MADDLIRYDVLVQDAMRALVRKVLSEVAQAGLPGDHHFFITFDTRAPGVRVSSRLTNDYPEDMTIVLQHQFWDLEVTDSSFEVGLSFKGVPEKLVVPLRAITSFADPHAGFAVKFDVSAAMEADEAEASPAAAEVAAAEPAPAAEAGATETGTAAVVSLDAFRKKNG